MNAAKLIDRVRQIALSLEDVTEKISHVGPAGWIGVHLDKGLDWAVISDLVRQGHQTTALKARGKRSPAARRRG